MRLVLVVQNAILGGIRQFGIFNVRPDLCHPLLGGVKPTNKQVDDLYSRIRVEIQGHDPAALRSYLIFASLSASYLEISTKIQSSPRQIRRWSVLKAPMGKAKHLVQYETRTHRRIIDMFHLTGSTADTYLSYLQLELPEGVAMTVERRRMDKLPAVINK